MKLVPLGDKIVLKQLEAEETTKSGIVLPGQAKEKPQEAEVIAVGPGGMVDGNEVTLNESENSVTVCPQYSLSDNGKMYRADYPKNWIRIGNARGKQGLR